LTKFLFALTSSNINQFSKSFTVRIRRKFAIIPSLKIPPHPKCVAALPCELSLSGANCRSVSLITHYWLVVSPVCMCCPAARWTH